MSQGRTEKKAAKNVERYKLEENPEMTFLEINNK